MNHCRNIVVAVVIVGTSTLTMRGEDTVLPDAKYTKWVWPVATGSGASSEQIQHLRELKEALNINWDVQLHQSNPGCCLWVEVVNWKPNPGDEGYIILIQGGGAWIQATNAEQLRLAIEQMKKVVVKKESSVYLPEGILTSYRIVSLAHGHAEGKRQ